MYEFPPTPEAAQLRLDHVSPKDYAHTRNALDGAVTHLSPYLTHGFLSNFARLVTAISNNRAQ